MGGIATSSPIVRDGLGQLCGVCVSYTWKPFEPFVKGGEKVYQWGGAKLYH